MTRREAGALQCEPEPREQTQLNTVGFAKAAGRVSHVEKIKSKSELPSQTCIFYLHKSVQFEISSRAADRPQAVVQMKLNYEFEAGQEISQACPVTIFARASAKDTVYTSESLSKSFLPV